MTSDPSNDHTAGEVYNRLRRLARGQGRATDELFQLYLLERFIYRWANSRLADRFVLKGGTLLAAYDLRRATRDIDVQALAVNGDAETVAGLVREICQIDGDDGVSFELDRLDARSIREGAPTRACGFGCRPRWGRHSWCCAWTSTSVIRSPPHRSDWTIRSYSGAASL